MSVTLATKMDSTEKRRRIVELAKDGVDKATIAREVGLNSRQAVDYHLKAWFEETRPDAEASAELRQMQWSRLEDIVASMRPHTLHVLRSAFGEPILDGDGQEQLVPNLPVVERLVRVYERQAKLMGLDLQQNVQVNVLPTAEQLASLFGWDATAVIEGTAVEEVVDG